MEIVYAPPPVLRISDIQGVQFFLDIRYRTNDWVSSTLLSTWTSRISRGLYFQARHPGAVELKKWISSTGRGRKSPMLQRKKHFQNKLINMYIK